MEVMEVMVIILEEVVKEIQQENFMKKEPLYMLEAAAAETIMQ